MFGLGMGEILIILVFALIFLGPKRLPELAKTIGKGLRDFQRAKQGLMDDINDVDVEEPKEATSQKTSEQWQETPEEDEHANVKAHHPDGDTALEAEFEEVKPGEDQQTKKSNS
jgi:sec-independent protein translocase protein TatA